MRPCSRCKRPKDIKGTYCRACRILYDAARLKKREDDYYWKVTVPRLRAEANADYRSLKKGGVYVQSDEPLDADSQYYRGRIANNNAHLLENE